MGGRSEVEEAFGPSEEKEPHKSTLADERVCVLGKQTDRLQEQVLCQQRLLAERLEERRALEAQLEGLVRDRDEQKSVQQKARGALHSTEAQLKVKEEELATASRRCQDLQHHSVRMRGEVRGLKARLAACEPAADTHNKAPAPEPGDEAKGSEQRRRISLRLQHEVVELWKALQKCKEEAACLKEPTDS